MENILKYLMQRPYPGRGIMMGKTLSGKIFYSYFIMGRSVNSRNRVFERTPDGLRTSACDYALMSDPSLIIYHPVRDLAEGVIVTNGNQSDTIRDFIKSGKSFYEALYTREFEPDAPNFTPRISAIYLPKGEFIFSILKTENGVDCDRFFYSMRLGPGEAAFISTYEGFGEPRPSFSGEPIRFKLPTEDLRKFSELVWEALDEENKVSLYTVMGPDGLVINKYGRS